AVGTANARMVPLEYPYHITYDWDPPFRQQRIEDLILDRGGHDIGSMRAAQMDAYDPAAHRLCALMVVAAQAGSRGGDAGLEQLAAGAGVRGADGAEPLIFTAWQREAVRAIYADDLGPAFGFYFDTRATALIRLLEGRTTGRDWCDDRTTPEREKCSDILA